MLDAAAFGLYYSQSGKYSRKERKRMDAFETLIATLLRHEGFWVHPSFRVELTREDKRAINRPSSPRWELDLLAYRPQGNIVRVVECKSYLDSTGVDFSDLTGGQYAGRFKLFTEEGLWKVVRARLVSQMEQLGMCLPSPRIELCLAAGKVASNEDRPRLRDLAAQQGWTFFDDEWLVRSVERLASRGYENDIATIVAKLLVRAKAGVAG
jgi:hypothetical protein